MAQGSKSNPVSPADPVPQGASRKDGMPLSVVDRTRNVLGSARRAPWVQRIVRHGRWVVLAWALVAFGGVIGLYFQPPGLRKFFEITRLEPGAGTRTPIAVPVERPSPQTKGGGPGALPPVARSVVGIGKILPRGDVIVIAPPYGASDARILRLAVEEGARVAAGDLLAVLDNEATLKAALLSAEATIAAREAAIRQTRDMVIASRDEARASLARAEATVVNTRRELDRVTDLRGKGFASDASYDQKRAAHDQAVQDVERSRATLSRYLFDDVASQSDMLVAQRNADSARAELSRAQADMEKAYVRAPTAGTVLTIHVRAGEKPGSQGILNLGDLQDMTAEIEVYQTLIGGVAVGQPVTITADALPGPLAGTVTRIGLEVGKQTMTDASPAANTDARVVKVYVKLDAAATPVAQRFTNLQVTGRIAVGAP